MLELSSFSTGRTPRFLRLEQIERIRREAGLAAITALSERERQYVELTDSVYRRLDQVDMALTRALARSKRRVEAAETALEDIRSRATITPDGRQAYRTEDRRKAFYDDGQEMAREEISAVDWREGAPSWEKRQQAGERVREAKKTHADLEDYKTRADYYRDRMGGGDALNEDDLKDMLKDLDAMPAELKAEFQAGPSDAITLDLADIAEIRQATPRPDFSR